MTEREPNGDEAGGDELRPGEYIAWVNRLLDRGLDPCLIIQDEQGREIDKWGNIVGPDARR